MLPYSLYVTSLILTTKSGKYTNKKKNHRSITLMDIDVKICNKILRNQVQQMILKWVQQHKRPQVMKTFRKKIKVRGILIPNFKVHYKVKIIKKSIVQAQKEPGRPMKQNRNFRSESTVIWSTDQEPNIQWE